MIPQLLRRDKGGVRFQMSVAQCKEVTILPSSTVDRWSIVSSINFSNQMESIIYWRSDDQLGGTGDSLQACYSLPRVETSTTNVACSSQQSCQLRSSQVNALVKGQCVRGASIASHSVPTKRVQIKVMESVHKT